MALRNCRAKIGKRICSGTQAGKEGTMIEFLIGLFLGSSCGFIFAGILAMGRDADKYAKRKHYSNDLKSGARLMKGRALGLGIRVSGL